VTAQRSPLDTALDLVLYAPVGLALTIGEEIPKMAAKGRTGLGSRVATARIVGQFAVAQGRREVSRRLSSPVSPTPRAPTAPGEAPTAPPRAPTAPGRAPAAPGGAPTASAPRRAAAAATSGSAGPSAAGTSAAGTSAPAAPVGAGAVANAPAVTSLAIPGYDSLSASQVVQRLGGLSDPELQAVKEYEAASRGRRTILARVGQLQSS
jgi:hypothetical protein